MTQKINTFLMFEGRAEEAMNFYISLFAGSRVTELVRYGANEQGAEGSIMRAIFSLNGQDFMCIDSPVKHGFSFTPSISLFVNCETVEEIDDLFAKLSEGGQVLMPLGDYGFSARFGWCDDRFGVSWQLTLA